MHAAVTVTHSFIRRPEMVPPAHYGKCGSFTHRMRPVTAVAARLPTKTAVIFCWSIPSATRLRHLDMALQMLQGSQFCRFYRPLMR